MNNFYILLLALLAIDCKSQAIITEQVYREFVYSSSCKILVPQYFVKDKYFYVDQSGIYTMTDNNWCAQRVDLGRDTFLPNGKKLLDYRVLNDTLLVALVDESFDLLYQINYVNGAFDTINLPKDTSLEIGQVLGGAFGTDEQYYLSSRTKKAGVYSIFKFDILNGSVDSLSSSLSLENGLARIRSSRTHLAFDYGVNSTSSTLPIEILDWNNRLSYLISERFDYLDAELGNYGLLDFIDDRVVLCHDKSLPFRFSLLNVENGKFLKFELDANVFSLENIRRERVLRQSVDGPNEGLNQLAFKYYFSSGPNKSFILSFTDKQDYRLGYRIDFDDLIEQLK